MADRNCAVAPCCNKPSTCEKKRQMVCDRCPADACYGIDGLWLCTGCYLMRVTVKANHG